MHKAEAGLWTVSTAVLATALAMPAAAQTAAAQNEPTVSTPAANPSSEQVTTPQQRAGETQAEAAAATTDEPEIVVTGVRASLQGAQQIRRNSDAVVDSIVAEDIGKLPDNTVSDALQRVTGVQVQRAQGEATSVVIRGLPDVQTFINGREAFTGTGRGVSLQDIPAELVAGVDVFKTATPEQVEGTVTGRIDIRLRRPFDFRGLQVAGSARTIYGEQIKKFSYVASGLVSNRWEFGDGQELGVLIGASYNRRKFYDQTAFNFGFEPFTGPATGGTAVLIPDTVGGLATVGTRERPAVNFSVQYKPNPDLEFFADGLFTGYRNDYNVDFFVGLPKAGNVTTVDTQTGSATTETRNRPVASSIVTRDNFTITSRQAFTAKTDGYQFNVGSRYQAGPALLSTEFTYNDSKVASQALILDTSFFVPQINYSFNNGGTPSLNFNGFDVTNATNFNLFTLFDNRDLSTSKQYAWRGDVVYEFEGSPIFENFKVGARYARRTGSFGGTNTGGIALGSFPGLPGSGFPGLASNAPGNFLGGRVGIDRFGVASREFILDNIENLRTIGGVPPEGRPFDPTRVFELKEDVYAFYGQLGFNADPVGVPIEGVVGARVVNTVTNLDSIFVSGIPGSPPTPIGSKQNQLNILPNLTVKIAPIEDVILRFVAGKSITRPQFGQLNPATTLSQQGATGGARGSGSGGNADLRYVKSDNLDASIEWYFSNTGSFTVTGFYRKLDGYIQTYGASEFFPNPNGQLAEFLIARPRNTEGGRLKGVEVAYQQFFDFLPGFLSGFGAQANFTLSDGKVKSPPNAAGISTNQDIIQVSKYSYNLVGIYEKYGFSARLAYNWRSKFTDSYNEFVPGGRIVAKPLAFLDFSANYDVTDNITVTVDATNLLKEKYHDNFGTSGFTPRDTRSFDRTFGGGVRFRF